MSKPNLLQKLAISGVAALGTIAATGVALADPIPPMEVRAAFENIVVDTEFGLLTYFEGSPSDILNYSSVITDIGWNGTLSGIYAGKPLNINYVGNTADLSSMSWTGTGTWGTEDWVSSGMANYTDPPLEGILDLENMQVGLSVSGTIGAGSITAKLVKDLDDLELIGSIAASALDVPVLGSVLEKELSLTLSQEDFTYESEEAFRVLFGILSKNIVVNSGRLFHCEGGGGGGGCNGGNEIPGFNPNPGDVTINQMQIQAVPVPEPSSILGTIAFGILGLTSGLKRQLKPSNTNSRSQV